MEKIFCRKVRYSKRQRNSFLKDCNFTRVFDFPPSDLMRPRYCRSADARMCMQNALLFATTRNITNNMQQGVQTDATCNIQQCLELLANNVVFVFTGLKSLEISDERISMKVQVSSTTVPFLRKKNQWQILKRRKIRCGKIEKRSRGVESIVRSLSTLPRSSNSLLDGV